MTTKRVIHINTAHDFAHEYQRLKEDQLTPSAQQTPNHDVDNGKRDDSSVEYRVSERLIGRICRARDHVPSDRETFSDNSSDRSVFFMGCDGLGKLLEIGPSDPFGMLRAIGYEQRFVEWRLSQGYSFELIVLTMPDNGNENENHDNGKDRDTSGDHRTNEEDTTSEVCFPGTWSGIFRMCSVVFHDVYRLIHHFEHELSQTDFDHYAQHFNFFEVKQLGASSPDYLNYHRFRALYLDRGSTDRATQLTALEARKFLYFEMSAQELFSGDGYTKNEQGERVFREYLFRNRRRSEIRSDHTILPLLRNCQRQLS